MSAFQRKVAGPAGAQPRLAPTPAPKTLTLRPEQFASTWSKRPSEPITIGLRVTSEHDRDGAEIEAYRVIGEKPLDNEEALARSFEDTRACVVVARGICDPNNVLSPHPLLPLPDDQITRAFPTSTLRWLFDEIDVLNVSQSPGFSEASDEEVAKLCDILTLDDSPIDSLPPMRAARMRRLLWAVLTEIE